MKYNTLKYANNILFIGTSLVHRTILLHISNFIFYIITSTHVHICN